MQLKPQTISLIEASRLFHAGAVTECLAGLDGASEHAAVILGTRCYIRLGRISDAEATIEAYWKVIRDSGSDIERGEVSMLRGNVAGKLGKRLTALSAFGDARGYLFGGSGVDLLVADLENSQAAFAIVEGDVDSAIFCAEQALEVGGLRQRVVARDVLSHVKASRDDFRGQLALLEESLAELAGSADNDYLTAATLKNVAILSQQQDRIDRYESLRSIADTLSFVGLAKNFESDLYRELGLLSARFGDHLTAFRYLRRSADCAPTVFHKLWALLDGVAVAREIGETVTSADRLAHAEELAGTIDWAATTTNDRLILFVLAEEQARAKPGAARQTLDKVSKLTRGKSPNTGPMMDRRFQATAMRANGVVAKAEGSMGLSASHLLQAFEYWKSIGFHWEAAMTAVEALELPDGDRYVSFLESYLERVPSAYIRRRLESAIAQPSVLAS